MCVCVCVCVCVSALSKWVRGGELYMCVCSWLSRYWGGRPQYASLAQLIQLSRPAPHKATISALHCVSLSLSLSLSLLVLTHLFLSFSQVSPFYPSTPSPSLSLCLSVSLSQGLLSHALLPVLYNVFVAVMKSGGSVVFYTVWCQINNQMCTVQTLTHSQGNRIFSSVSHLNFYFRRLFMFPFFVFIKAEYCYSGFMMAKCQLICDWQTIWEGVEAGASAYVTC